MRLLIAAPAALLVACSGANAAQTAPAKGQPSFSIPYGLAVGPGGAIFIADGGSGRVLRYEPPRRRMTVVAHGFREPTSLERAPDGTLFVSDIARNRVVRIDR